MRTFSAQKGTELQNAMDIVHAIAIDGVDYMSVTYAPAAPQSARALRLPLRSGGAGSRPWPI